MIAIDTNCLLRRVLNDDAVQLAKVNALFAKPDQILITDVVLVETVWAMQTFAVPKPGRDDIYAMVRSLFDDAKIEFENKHVVWNALNDFLNAPMSTGKKKKRADFADTLIINKARLVIDEQVAPGDINNGIYTFDAGALMLAGTFLPE